MRFNAFVKHLQDRFDFQSDNALAMRVAEALNETDHGGMGHFTHDGVTYTIMAAWKDGCIAGDCNPATCWTEWEVSP